MATMKCVKWSLARAQSLKSKINGSLHRYIVRHRQIGINWGWEDNDMNFSNIQMVLVFWMSCTSVIPQYSSLLLLINTNVQAGYLDIVKLLVDAGSSTVNESNEGKIPLWYACIEQNKFVVEYLLRCNHDTYSLLEDRPFTYNLMKIAKNDNQKSVEDYIFISPAPCDTSAKLSAICLSSALRGWWHSRWRTHWCSGRVLPFWEV